jgi:hypothetical protein
MSLAVSPDTRHIKEHRVAPVVPGAQDHAVRISQDVYTTVFSRGTLVEGTGLEPVLPAYQTGILPLNEPSILLCRNPGAVR